ncbi:MAG UNVERIFIED_CONTAM: hypothetical protein LVR18_40865 [Planctomycetaceae bacterium]
MRLALDGVSDCADRCISGSLNADCRYSELTFRISTQQASPAAICRRRLFPIVLIPAPPVSLDTETRVVAGRTNSCQY